MKNKTKKLIKASLNMGLIVKESKTKYLVMSRNVTPKNNLKMYGRRI